MTPDALARLAGKREAFLRFARSRLGDEERAEELLQAAYARASEPAAALRNGESAEAWFYQVLRNAAADLHRRRARSSGTVELDEALEELGLPPEQLREVACACVAGVIETLTPAHARLVRRVDLEGASVPAVAAEEGITPNNAGVRLHRARAALRERLRRACGACARHGCLDCHCRAQSAL
jgi:RNA polymerase sigma-70 factor (ECF subfamily)